MFRAILKPGPRYSWRRVFLILALSCAVVSGSYFAYRYTRHLQVSRSHSVIQAIVQTAAEYAPLQTTYFAEALELSRDHPINLMQFDLIEAQERLMATHLLRKVLVKKIKPSTLYIEYALRTPLAFLGDYTNTALDSEGNLFPYLPFYPPRKLPQVYLGERAPPNPWGEHVAVEAAVAILDRFEVGEVVQIDLSQIAAASAGEREIVVVLKGGTILRLSSKNYLQELTEYFMLDEQLTRPPRVIDFRNPNTAYITYGS